MKGHTQLINNMISDFESNVLRKFTELMASYKNVSDDYNKLKEVFANSNSFLIFNRTVDQGNNCSFVSAEL